MGIPPDAALIVMHALPSLGTIIETVTAFPPEVLAETIPVDTSYLATVSSFFQIPN
jgi:hypothetical protein